MAEGTRGLTQRGHECHVVLPAEGPLRKRLDNAAEIHVIPHNPWAGGRVESVALLHQQVYNFFVARGRIARLTTRVRADVVVSNTITVSAGALAARRRGVPHVWNIHEIALSERGVHFLIGRRPTLFLMRHLAAGYIVNSEATGRSYAGELPQDLIRVVPYAVETADIPRRETGAGDPFRVVLVAQKSPGKGQHEAIAAIHALVSRGLDVELMLIGSGEPVYEAELRQLAAAPELDGRVRFIDFQVRPAELVAAADVALTCSRWEAFGRTTIEAMKLGTPVIGAEHSGTAELIRDGWNGLLYEPGATGQLAACIERLYWNRVEARRVGDQAREWAREQFTLARYAEALEVALSAFLGYTSDPT
jgi:glycosyltransferase involved in cell wall biosynthesis